MPVSIPDRAHRVAGSARGSFAGANSLATAKIVECGEGPPLQAVARQRLSPCANSLPSPEREIVPSEQWPRHPPAGSRI